MALNIKLIEDKPTTINNIHESCYRCFSVLLDVREMLDRGDSVATIKEFLSIVDSMENKKDTSN